jgi:catecholate siderophore receptor
MSHVSPRVPSSAHPGAIACATRLRRVRLAQALLLALAAPAPALMAAEVPDGEPSRKLPEMHVEGEQIDGYTQNTASSKKLTEPLRETPRSIAIIPESLMQEQAVSSLRDALRNVAGIAMSAGEGGVPAGDNLTLRGFSARTDLFVDGARDFGGYFRDPFNLETIEVVKGPSSSYSGRGATGGSVNQVSKTPTLDAFNRASLSAGTDSYLRGTADLNMPIESLGEGAAVRVNVMGHDADTAGRDFVKESRWGVAPSLALGLGSDTEFHLGLVHLDQDNVPDYGIPYLDGVPVRVDRENWYGLEGLDHEDTVTDLATARIEHDFSERVSVSSQLRWGEAERQSIITAARSPDFSADTMARSLKLRDSEDRILSSQTDLRIDFETGAVRHAMVAGVELTREDSRNNGRSAANVPLASLIDPDPRQPHAVEITATSVVDGSADSQAAYVIDTLEFGEHWELNAGLRWDRFDLDYDSSTAPTLSRTDTDTNGQLGLVFKPSDIGAIYAAWGSSFNPSAEGLTLRDTLVDVDPETSRSIELGTKWDFLDGDLAFTAALFRIDKTNARTAGATPDDPPTVLEGEQRVDGAEVSLTGRINESVSLFAAYTHLDSEIRESNVADELGSELPNVAPNTLNLWARFDLAERWQAGVGAQYVDERWANSTNTNRVEDYWLMDAMLAYELNAHTQLQLNVTNLTDEDYFGAIYPGHAVPGRGRTAILSAAFEF